MRRRRAYQRDPSAAPQPGSVDESLARLASTACRATSLHKAVCALRIELVLTAHPTEIMRRTLQYKYGRTAEALAGLDRADATPLERDALVEALKREIQAAWETEDVRRDRPSPLEEVRAALTIFDQILWNAVPEFLRSLDRTLAPRHAPRSAARRVADPVRVVDRRRSRRQPAVTADVTRRACLVARRVGRDALSPRDRRAARGAVARGRNRGPARPCRHAPRALSRGPSRRPAPASRHAARGSTHASAADVDEPAPADVYERADDFAEPLRLCYRSLHATGNGIVADGRLLDVLRRLAAFGLTLVRLDVRQEAKRHADAIDAITRRSRARRVRRVAGSSSASTFSVQALGDKREPLPADLTARSRGRGSARDVSHARRGFQRNRSAPT